MGLDLFSRERGARLGLAAGIADHCREIADQKNGGVAAVLKMFELAKDDGVAEVQIGGRGVDAEFYAQRLAGLGRLLELGLEFVLANDFRGAFAEVGQVVGEWIRFVTGKHFIFST